MTKLPISYAIKLFLIRTVMIGLYLSCYKNIMRLTYYTSSFISNPSFLMGFLDETKILRMINKKSLKSFLVIVFIFTILIPIFKTFMSETASDTIFLMFSIFQLIYAVDSVKISILSKNQTKKDFSRSCNISLEEALLIPCKKENNCVWGNMAAVMGFMVLYSRIQKNSEIIVQQIFGFILYITLPHFLDTWAKRDSNFLLFLLFSFILMYTANKQIFFIFSNIIYSLLIAFSIMLLILSNHQNRSVGSSFK